MNSKRFADRLIAYCESLMGHASEDAAATTSARSRNETTREQPRFHNRSLRVDATEPAPHIERREEPPPEEPLG